MKTDVEILAEIDDKIIDLMIVTIGKQLDTIDLLKAENEDLRNSLSVIRYILRSMGFDV